MRSCKTAQVLMAKEQADELSAHEQGYLQNHFRSCPSCREQSKELTSFFESLGSLGQVRTAPSPAARSRFITQTKALQPVGRRASVRKRTSARSRIPTGVHVRSRGRRYLLAFAAAAAVLLVAAVLWMTQGGRQRPDGARETRPPVAHQGTAEPLAQNPAPALVAFRDPVTVRRAGRLLPVSAGLQLTSGDRLETAEKGHARLRYPDGTVVELNINTLLHIGGEPSGKRLTLERGDIFADVAKQPREAPMLLNPGRADQVRVVGTAFELSRRNECTRLLMAAGLVSFGPPDHAVVVKEGLSSLVEHSSAPSEPSPCEPSSIAGWRAPDGEAPAQPEAAPSPTPPAHAPGTSQAEDTTPQAAVEPAGRQPDGPTPVPGPAAGAPPARPRQPVPPTAPVETGTGGPGDKNDSPSTSPGKGDKDDRDKGEKDKPDKAKDDPKVEATPPEAPAAAGGKPVPPGKAVTPRANPKPTKTK